MSGASFRAESRSRSLLSFAEEMLVARALCGAYLQPGRRPGQNL